jgi:hypothetical protein
MPQRQIPPERKAIFYIGMVVGVIGFLCFISTFFSAAFRSCATTNLSASRSMRPPKRGFWRVHEARMTKPTFAFILLCVAAVAVQLLERYGLLHWGVERDLVLSGLLLGGLALLITLFIWSLISVRRYKLRAVFGVLVCAYCLWHVFQNGQIIY